MSKNLRNVESILDDFFSLFERGPGMKPTPIETALYLEDCLDIVLSDEELSSSNLESPESIKRLVEGRLGS